MPELIVREVVFDQAGDLAGHAEGRLEAPGEALNDPLLGEGQLGVSDGPPAGDIAELLEKLDERLLCHSGLDRTTGFEGPRAAQEREARGRSVTVALVLAQV